MHDMWTFKVFEKYLTNHNFMSSNDIKQAAVVWISLAPIGVEIELSRYKYVL